MNKNIEEIVKEISILQNIKLKNVIKEVDYIINNDVIDSNILEQTLDKLLDLTFHYGNDINNIYYKLLNYYEKIDKKSSEEYEKLYIKILNNENF